MVFIYFLLWIIPNYLVGDYYESNKWLGLTKSMLKECQTLKLRQDMMHHLESMMVEEEEQSALFIEHVLNETNLMINTIDNFMNDYKLEIDRFQSDMNRLYTMQLSKLFVFGYNNGSDIESDLNGSQGLSREQATLSHLPIAWIEKFGLDYLRMEGIKAPKRMLVRRILNSFTSELKLDFSTIFSSIFNSESAIADENSSSSSPLKLEICSGQGEWVVTQAKHDPGCRWVAMELRCNRVYDIFTQTILNKLENLCILQGDARHIIPTRIQASSIDYVFINHPEPPERVVGKGSTQGKHLLTTEFFNDVYDIMQINGKLSIVSDNLPYMKELTNQLANEFKQKFTSVGFEQGGRSYMNEWELDDVTLWRGELPEESGIKTEASSYFDRLWNKGQKTRRWFLMVRKQ